MSQRSSGYSRKRNDAYQTPPWVTQVLCDHLSPSIRTIWEPAAGKGLMAKELRRYGFKVISTDMLTGTNFLARTDHRDVDAIVTNPPFELAEEFIAHALDLMQPRRGVVAMLARIDYDSASTRRYLFSEHPAFAMKIILTKRIIWFAKKGAAPSYNHQWLMWDWGKQLGSPITRYGP